MPCGTIVGNQLAFGIESDEDSLVTQSLQVTNKADTKEARNHCGNVVSKAFYNKMSEVQFDGLGTSSLAVGSALSLANTTLTLAGALYVDEISIDLSNEDYVKSSVKATAYEGIPAS